MEKYLLTIEFRYKSIPTPTRDYDSRSKTITIGVYDSYEDACENGNNLMESLENRFPLHVYSDGRTSKRGRFSRNGGPYGTKNDLISDMNLKTPFQFFAKITTLKYEVVDEVINSIKKYKVAHS